MSTSAKPCKVTIIHHVGASGHPRRSHRQAGLTSSLPQVSSSPVAPTPSGIFSRLWQRSMPAKGYAKAHIGTSTVWVRRDRKEGKDSQLQDGPNLSNLFIHQGQAGLNSAGDSSRSLSPTPPIAVTPAFSAQPDHDPEGGEGASSAIGPHGGALKTPRPSHPYPSFCLGCKDYWSNRYYPRCCWHAGPQCFFGKIGYFFKYIKWKIGVSS